MPGPCLGEIMISQSIQLLYPNFFSVSYYQLELEDKVLIKPEYLALCHADQRYYQGKRSAEVLRQKLPMALIHEACGKVVYDPTGKFDVGQKVVMIPNDPPELIKGYYENYLVGTEFLSSGNDGFMREIVELRPDRVVAYDGIPDKIAAITEFVSVAFHGLDRLNNLIHKSPKKIAVYGDGNLSFTLSLVLRNAFPDTKIVVIGKHPEKLRLFSFVDKTFVLDQVPQDLHFDHAFECVGGEGSFNAINDIIKHIQPQGNIILMGVSEFYGAINTRDVLEKGLILVGSSRSGRDDFTKAVEFLRDPDIQSSFELILRYAGEASSINDIHDIFMQDGTSPYKTVFKWGY